MIEEIYLLVGGCAVIFLFGSALTLSVAVRTIGKHFDKLFKNKKHYIDNALPGMALVNRTMRYMICIVLNRNKIDKMLKSLYGNYDFKSNASKFEYYLSIFFFIQFSISMILMFISIALRFFM